MLPVAGSSLRLSGPGPTTLAAGLHSAQSVTGHAGAGFRPDLSPSPLKSIIATAADSDSESRSESDSESETVPRAGPRLPGWRRPAAPGLGKAEASPCRGPAGPGRKAPQSR